MAHGIYSDKSTNVGMQNALLRAQQLLKLRWTPVDRYPVVYPTGLRRGDTLNAFFQPHHPQIGVGYSAVGYANEKYVGSNVSLHTYMTAISNPNSVLYQRNQHERGPLCAAFYGAVCSQFASYVLGFPFHIDCPQFSQMEDMEHIDGSQLENLQLCDLLNEPKTHTAVITGIDRNENGKVVRITVTEGTPPQIRSNSFLPEEFVNYWLKDGFEVLRYKKLSSVPYTPDPWVPLEGDPELPRPVPNEVLLPDYGDRANYRLGESVEISVFDSSYTEILLLHNETETLLTVEDGVAAFCPEQPGYYQVFAVSSAGKSQPVEFCVTRAAITTDKDRYSPDETIHLAFSCEAEDELVGFMVKKEKGTKYWGYVKENGILTDSLQLPEGKYYIIAHYRNPFGVYTATPTPVFCVE